MPDYELQGDAGSQVLPLTQQKHARSGATMAARANALPNSFSCPATSWDSLSGSAGAGLAGEQGWVCPIEQPGWELAGKPPSVAYLG